MNVSKGIVKPADLGIDVMHYNLHKTFSTPHGGGGPGSGPVGVVDSLVDFLPGPIVKMCEPGEDGCCCDEDGCDCEDGCNCDSEEEVHFHLVRSAKSIGRVKNFYGQFGVIVRAYTYLRMLGAEGVRKGMTDIGC